MVPLAEVPRYEQSAVIPYRFRDGDLEVLLLRNRKDSRWIVPKGLVEPHLTPALSAAQEAWEEGGARGPVHPGSIGRFEYEKWGGVCEVEVYLMRVESLEACYPEDWRARRWVPPEEAAEMVREPELRAWLLDLDALVAQAGALE